MLFSEILLFVVFAGLLVVSPGPNGLLIARSVGVSGKPRALFNILGFVSAFYLHGLVSILGLSAILMKSSEIYFIFKLLGAAYLSFIGVKALISAYSLAKQNTETPALNSPPTHRQYSKFQSFLEGLLTNGLNPKVSLFYLAAFPQFIGQSDSMLYWGMLLVSVHAIMNACWFYILACVVQKTKSLVLNIRFKQCLQYLTGLIFIGFAIKLVSSKQSV